MITLPLRFRPIDSTRIAFADDAGRLFIASEGFLERYASGHLDSGDRRFLLDAGLLISDLDDLAAVSWARQVAERIARPRTVNYLILVPTLRCDLDCTYCQVSRVPIHREGHDWSEATLAALLRRIDLLPTTHLKVEFQGGEPLLRTDLLQAVIDFCSARFESTQFVICTNLSSIPPSAEALIERDDVYISTSLDGPATVHEANRTLTPLRTRRFLANLDGLLTRFGPAKISALPTVNYLDPPDPGALLEAFACRGLTSIFLRPISFHGFARKTHGYVQSTFDAWNNYYGQFIDALLLKNSDRELPMEEYYLTLALHRLLAPHHDGHLDLRNPAYMGHDCLVVDYDGTIYPTDEARMLARAGQIDLSIGHIERGVDQSLLLDLNHNAANNFDADCLHCVYQPACGADPIDDIARHGRVDLPRPSTFFCQRQLNVFDTAIRLLESDDATVQRSLQSWLRLPGLSPRLLRCHQ